MTAPNTALTATSQPLRGMLLIVVATLLFASHDVLSKYLSGFYPVMLVIWVRYLIHTLLMVGIFLPQSGLRILRTRRPLLQVVRASFLLGTSLFFITGLQHIPIAEATAVNFLSPLLVTALSVPLLKEKVSKQQWACVLVGFCGVMTIVHPGGELFTPAILFPFASALCFCFYQLLTRQVAKVDSPTTSNFFAGVFNTLVMSVVVWWFWEVPTLWHAVLMVFLGGCGMGAHLLLTQAFRYAPPALLAPFGYCQIVFAGLFGWLIFNHTPPVAATVGMGIICCSGVAAAWVQRRAAKRS